MADTEKYPPAIPAGRGVPPSRSKRPPFYRHKLDDDEDVPDHRLAAGFRTRQVTTTDGRYEPPCVPPGLYNVNGTVAEGWAADDIYMYCREVVNPDPNPMPPRPPMPPRKNIHRNRTKLRFKMPEDESELPTRADGANLYRIHVRDAANRGHLSFLSETEFCALTDGIESGTRYCLCCGAPVTTLGMDRHQSIFPYGAHFVIILCGACNNGKGTKSLRAYVRRCDRIMVKWPAEAQARYVGLNADAIRADGSDFAPNTEEEWNSEENDVHPNIKLRAKQIKNSYIKGMVRNKKISKSAATKRFEMKAHEVEQYISGECYYCGFRSRPEEGKTAECIIGLDRVVPAAAGAQGYKVGEVVPCCKDCNIHKNNLSANFFLAQALGVAANNALDCLRQLKN